MKVNSSLFISTVYGELASKKSFSLSKKIWLRMVVKRGEYSYILIKNGFMCENEISNMIKNAIKQKF